ncbi:hypothetical protein JAAARDRAFT_31025 [Jaapia argillacea MUCL 33604]|uniref:J domain-containing protein n=1 Tax=Jaapia argillacea MUCL 33604 TaxID=933084 RepID=A0A067Q3C8_9AGAM|nr:hypothetical protein JAAARDRAFT_31025 [Jaapia argillacea MUCL 33604]
MSNLYEILGISKDATNEEIRKAYKKAALKTHPDRLPQGITPEQKAEAEEKFRVVNNAYEVLSDPENRKIFDMYGVWPPPTAREAPNGPPPGPSRRSDRDEAFRDPFFDFPDPFGGPQHHFAYSDPFELFERIFGDVRGRGFASSPFFNDPLFGGVDFGHGPSRGAGIPSMDPFGFVGGFGRGGGSIISPFGGMFGPVFEDTMRGSRGGTARTMSYSSAGFDNDQGGVRWVSSSKMTRTINGVTESVWKRRDSQGNEHVTLTYPDGREVYTINGVEQSPQGYIQDPPQPSNQYIQQPPPPQSQPPRPPPQVQSNGNRYVQPPPNERYIPPPPIIQSNGPPYVPTTTAPPVQPQPEYTYTQQERAPRHRSTYSQGSGHGHAPVIPDYPPRAGERGRDRDRGRERRQQRGYSVPQPMYPDDHSSSHSPVIPSPRDAVVPSRSRSPVIPPPQPDQGQGRNYEGPSGKDRHHVFFGHHHDHSVQPARADGNEKDGQGSNRHSFFGSPSPGSQHRRRQE